MTAATDRALHWDDEQEMLGVRVRVRFFDADRADAAADWIDRLLPLFAPDRPTALHAQGERGQWSMSCGRRSALRVAGGDVAPQDQQGS